MFNFGLENWANTTISILIWVAVAYIAFIIMNLLFIAYFKKVLHQHSRSMSLALNSKLDNIKKLFNLMKNLGVEVDEKYFKIIEEIDPTKLERQYTDECKKAREKLTYLRDEAMYIARSQTKLEKNKEFITAKNSVLEMDTVYRNTVACYNADVIGYNYWIKFLPNRWIFKLAKVREKDLI